MMNTDHYDPPLGPQDVASFFLHAILDQEDLRLAWTATDAPLRLELARGWVTANAEHPLVADEDPDELAQALGAIDPLDPLWPYFEHSVLDTFFEAWQNVELDRWLWVIEHHLVDVDHELVIYTDPASEQRIDGQRTMDALTWTMRHDPYDGWWIAGLGDEMASPVTIGRS